MAKGKKETLSLEELLEQAIVKEQDRPYEVPENWVWAQLGSVCSNVQYGYTVKSTTDNIGPKLLRITDIQDGLVDWSNVPHCSISESDYDKFNIHNGDIVVARTGATTGKSYLISENVNSVFASYLIRVSLNKRLSYKFLYKLMQSDLYWNQIMDLSQGIAQPGVNAAKLQSMLFPIPPLAEQQRIVEVIESLFEKLDTAKELVQNALDSFESRKAAILHKAFTGELTARWREENKTCIEALAEIEEGPYHIPKEWRWTSLEELISTLGDGLHGTPKYSDTGEYYFINGNNLNDGKIEIKSDTKKVDVSEFEKYKKKLTLNTVFVSINGTLGNTAFYNNEPIILGKSACYFNLLDNYNKFYIRYYLQTLFFKNYANSEATGSTIKNLSLKSMRNLPVPMASLPEQQEIVRMLDNFMESEQRAKELSGVIEKIDLMKKAILARAFRGELGTNSPEEESAVELLKEVLKERVES